MSGALVLYEVLRVYERIYKVGKIIENAMLYQWVGVTLLTDAVVLGITRNQWYIDKTMGNMDVEVGLKKTNGKLE